MIRSIHSSLRTSCSIAAVCTLAAATRAQTLVRAVNGPSANAQYGKACVVVPDQNGDGYKDLLVGAPGFNQLRGAILCLSGAYLATGVGTQTLWSFAPTANQGDLFGTAITDMGDLTGDGVHDFLVGQPGYDNGTTQDVGAVQLINGATHAAVALRFGSEQGEMFGSAMAATGDSNGDGSSEVAIGAPGPNTNHSKVYSFANGLAFLFSGAIANLSGLSSLSADGAARVGASIASGFDLDGDGNDEFAVGAPGLDSSTGVIDAGLVAIISRTPGGIVLVALCEGDQTGEQLGASVSGLGDCDGDGVADIVAGAPGFLDSQGGEAGRALVLSGTKLAADTPPFGIYDLRFALANGFDHHFGAAVSACDDLNGDGVGDILVGAPDYFTFGSGGQFQLKGHVSVFSGRSGARFVGFVGVSGDKLGDALAGAVDDLDGDGFEEFVVAGSLSDAGGTDSGVVKCYRLFPVPPSTYCTGKLNSLGCTPAIAFSGTPSATSTAPFSITASNFINQKTGLLFYSHAPLATAFQGGFKCAADPVRRTGALTSGGSASGADCTGTYSLDFNARIASGVDPSLTAGAEIYAQYWSRDPQSASHTALSNAIRFVVGP